ncbi:MAG: hypothetical protein ACT4QF_07015 [Sporichthyaceae bacterium]
MTSPTSLRLFAAYPAEPTPTPTPTPTASVEGGAAAPACGFGVVTCAAPGTAAPRPEIAPAQPNTVLPSGPTTLDELAAQTAQGAREVLKDTYGAWLDAPSLSAGADNGLGLQALMLGLAAAGLSLVAIWQGIRLMVTRRGLVLAELLRGLLIAALVTAAGIAVIDSALLAGDQISSAVTARAFGTTDALVTRMGEVLLGTQTTDRAPVLVLFFALLVLVLGIAQAVFLVLRQVAIPLLGALLPIAAVGQAGPRYTQTWLTKLLALVLAICIYKPLVVIVLAMGFAGPAPAEYRAMDATRGLVSLMVAVALFPVVVRLFAPAARVVVERGMDLPSRGSRSAPAGAGTPGEFSAVHHATWMAGATGSAPTVLAPQHETGRAGAPPVPGQATGVAAASGGAVSVPSTVVVREAVGRGAWAAARGTGNERVIGQGARGEGGR